MRLILFAAFLATASLALNEIVPEAGKPQGVDLVVTEARYQEEGHADDETHAETDDASVDAEVSADEEVTTDDDTYSGSVEEVDEEVDEDADQVRFPLSLANVGCATSDTILFRRQKVLRQPRMRRRTMQRQQSLI